MWCGICKFSCLTRSHCKAHKRGAQAHSRRTHGAAQRGARVDLTDGAARRGAEGCSTDTGMSNGWRGAALRARTWEVEQMDEDGAARRGARGDQTDGAERQGGTSRPAVEVMGKENVGVRVRPAPASLMHILRARALAALMIAVWAGWG